MKIAQLHLVAATPETVAPYGSLIDVPAQGGALPVAFYEDSVRVYKPVNFISDEDTEITLASIDRRPMKVIWLERHFKHTQSFIPLSGRPFVIVMAPPTKGELPDINTAQALLFDGSAGFMMHIGTWHEFPFALVDDTRLIVLLRGEATKALMKGVATDGEAHSGDLDKKNIAARLGVSIEVGL